MRRYVSKSNNEIKLFCLQVTNDLSQVRDTFEDELRMS